MHNLCKIRRDVPKIVQLLAPAAGWSHSGQTDTQGEEYAATREFCPECGVHIVTRSPALPGAVILKVGSLDDPTLFEQPQMILQTADAQSFHHIPDGVPAFERFPT